MTLTILELLYVVLIMFSSIIGTLLILVLIRLIRILGPAMELVDLYNKIKGIIKAYSSIPDMIKQKVADALNDKKDS